MSNKLVWPKGECRFCKKPASDEYCSDECAERFGLLMGYREKWAMRINVARVAVVALAIPGFFMLDLLFMFIGLALFAEGILLYVFPFNTWRSCVTKGMHRATYMAMVTGLLMLSAGIALIMMNSAFLLTDTFPYLES